MPQSFGPAVIRSLGILEEGPMCLAIPGKVTETYRQHDLLMGKVDFGGIAKRVCLEHVPEVRIGDYVLVHVGFPSARSMRTRRSGCSSSWTG